MKVISSYAAGAIVVGILETIDGVLLILNGGLINNFNLIVTLIELTWFLVSITFVVIFHRFKISLLSPISFITYILVGFTFASVSKSSQSTDVITVPVGFAAVGALFGIYYVIINERLRGQLAHHKQSSSE